MERPEMNLNRIGEIVGAEPFNIIVLGSGLEIVDKKGRPGVRLSHDAKMRLHAAQVLFELLNTNPNLHPKIIVCGGNVYEGYGQLAERSKKYLISVTSLNEKDIITVGGTSTLGDIERAMKFGKNAIVISNVYHFAAEYYAAKKEIGFISAEELLMLKSPLYKEIIEKMVVSNWYKDEFEKQIKLADVLRLPYGLGEIIYKIVSFIKKKDEMPGDWDREKIKKLLTEV